MQSKRNERPGPWGLVFSLVQSRTGNDRIDDSAAICTTPDSARPGQTTLPPISSTDPEIRRNKLHEVTHDSE